MSSKYLRSTSSTLAAIFNGMPARFAISMARSGRFSGAIRRERQGNRQGQDERDVSDWQTVGDRGEPIHIARHGQALTVRDRYQRHMWEGAVNGVEVREVEPTMQSGDTFMRHILKQNVLKQVDMEMDDVELIGVASNPVEHHGM